MYRGIPASEDAARQTTDVYNNLPLLRDLAVASSEKLDETKPVAERISHQSRSARWSSHWKYLNKKKCARWLDTRSVISRLGGLKAYQRFIHEEIEEQVEEFYHGLYQKPVLGSKEFIERVKQRLGEKARVEEEKPESRRLFSPGLDEIVQATAPGYKKTVEELKRRKRGRENEARMVAIYLGRQLGGHRHEEIGKNGWTRESVVGELGLFADEGASGEGEAASAKSAEDRRSLNKKQKADLTSLATSAISKDTTPQFSRRVSDGCGFAQLSKYANSL